MSSFPRICCALLAAAVAGGAVLVPTAAPAAAAPSADLAASFAAFTAKLPGTVQIAATPAGGTTTILGAQSTAKPGPNGKTRCTAVAQVGDSTSVAINDPNYLPNPADRADAAYSSVGVGKTIVDATVSRTIVETVNGNPNAATGVDQLIAQGFKGCWVIAMGVNDAGRVGTGAQVGAAERVERILGKLKGQDVLWPTIATTLGDGHDYGNQHMQAFNAAVAAARSRHPNLRVFDWATKAERSAFQPDGIHYTSQGAALRNKLFAQALVEAFPAGGHDGGAKDPAWGSIRVPIALAASVAGSSQDTVSAALRDSSSEATTELWRQLGPDPAKTVNTVLAGLGDSSTKVTAHSGANYEELAATTWTAQDQSRFGAGLLCVRERGVVTTHMSNPAGDRWGLQNSGGQPGVQFAAAHGGWGPAAKGFSARQLALLQTPRGLVSLSIIATTASGGQAEVVALFNTAAEWVVKNIESIPAQPCPSTTGEAGR